MMESAQASLQEGNLDKALSLLKNDVRDDPSNSALRIFLFQSLAVAGDYSRALTQLNVAAELDSDTLLMAQTYRELLQCEGFRSSVFRGEQLPLVFGEPPNWIGHLIQGLEASATGDGAQAMQLVTAAFEKAPSSKGQIDGQPFEWIADADLRLGPILEAVINGKYYWIPFSAIAEITLSEPEDLRDMVWLPAEFRWQNGGEIVGFIPSRYPEPEAPADPLCALARKTEWQDLGAEYFVGHGQKILSTDDNDHSLLDVRLITFEHTD